MSYRIEKTQEGIDIVISEWEKGISNNPYQGIADMRNVDNSTIPGEVSISMSTQTIQTQSAISGVTFTVDAGTNVFTYNGTIPLEINTAITFTNSGGALPAGLSANTAYYIISTPTPTTFTVSEISAGGVIKDVTGAGSGTNTFSTIQMGTPKYFTDYILNSYYRFYFMLDSNGRVWVYNSSNLGNTNNWIYLHNKSNETSTSGPNGLQAYKGYLFWFDATTINTIRIIDPTTMLASLSYLSTFDNWVISWKTLISTAQSIISHYSLVGQDDITYICNGNNVASIGEIPSSLSATNYTSFNIAETHTVADGVTTSGSKNITTVTTFFASTDVGAVIVGTGIPTGAFIASVTNSKAAVLSVNATGSSSGLDFTITKSYSYNASALDVPPNEQTTCLAELGQTLLIGSVSNKIYPWDRISPSFNYPIMLSENYVSRMVTVNTTTYIFCGYRGRIYVTNGSNVQYVDSISDNLSKVTSPYYIWKDAIFNRNQLYFGFSCTDNSGNTINEFGGLWTIDLKTNKIRMSNQMSYGTYSGYVSAIFQNNGNFQGNPSNDGYGLFIGWYSGSVGGIDKTISTPYSTGQAYIITDMIPVATKIYNKTFSQIEWKLTTPMGVGDSISIYARKSNNTSWGTVINTTSYLVAGQLSKYFDSNVVNAEWVQFKIVLSSASYTDGTGIHFKELRIR